MKDAFKQTLDLNRISPQSHRLVTPTSQVLSPLANASSTPLLQTPSQSSPSDTHRMQRGTELKQLAALGRLFKAPAQQKRREPDANLRDSSLYNVALSNSAQTAEDNLQEFEQTRQVHNALKALETMKKSSEAATPERTREGGVNVLGDAPALLGDTPVPGKQAPLGQTRVLAGISQLLLGRAASPRGGQADAGGGAHEQRRAASGQELDEAEVPDTGQSLTSARFKDTYPCKPVKHRSQNKLNDMVQCSPGSSAGRQPLLLLQEPQGKPIRGAPHIPT